MWQKMWFESAHPLLAVQQSTTVSEVFATTQLRTRRDFQKAQLLLTVSKCLQVKLETIGGSGGGVCVQGGLKACCFLHQGDT